MRRILWVLLFFAVVGSVFGDRGRKPDPSPRQTASTENGRTAAPASRAPQHLSQDEITRRLSRSEFRDICGRTDAFGYCGKVGYWAFNAYGHPALRGVMVGPIVGVAWRPKGSLTGGGGGVPRLSERDAFYFIIAPDDAGAPFLRMAREIAAR